MARSGPMAIPRTAHMGGILWLAPFGGVTAVFMVVVSYGYTIAARRWLGEDSAVLTVLVGLTVALVAWVLAAAAAYLRVDRDTARSEGWPARSEWIFPFAMLLAISAAGTVNSGFYIYEGPEIIAETTTQARRGLVLLGSQGEAALRDSKIESLRDQVNRTLADLKQRITDGGGSGQPQSCGIGVDARKEIEKLGRLLPGFAVVPRTEGIHACADRKAMEQIFRWHEEQALRLFNSSDLYVTGRGKEREVLGARLRLVFRENLSALDGIGRAVRASSAAGDSIKDYGTVLIVLNTAAATYSEMINSIDNVTGKPLELPAALSVDEVRQLGSLPHLPRALIKRLGQIPTWIYLLSALLVDWAMLSAWEGLIRRSRAVLPVGSTGMSQADAETEVHFLWNHRP